MQTRDGAAAAQAELTACKRQLDESGYCVVPDVLDADALHAVRARIEEQAQAERALGLAFEDGGPPLAEGDPRRSLSRAFVGVNQRVLMLVNKGREFVDLIAHPTALALAEHVLGPAFLLSAFTANIAKLGGIEQGLHCDDWWAPRSAPRARPGPRVAELMRFAATDAPDRLRSDHVTPCCMMNFGWMVTDFSTENGGTRIVPGSHLSGVQPDSTVPHRIETIAATGRAGSLLAFDGRLWHGTGRNVTPDPRIALFLTFCGPQFRPAENYFVGLDPEVYQTAPRKLRDLLGYGMWRGYGRVEDRGKPYVEPHEPRIPALRLQPRWGQLP